MVDHDKDVRFVSLTIPGRADCGDAIAAIKTLSITFSYQLQNYKYIDWKVDPPKHDGGGLTHYIFTMHGQPNVTLPTAGGKIANLVTNAGSRSEIISSGHECNTVNGQTGGSLKHIAWMHLGDANGQEDCMSRVLASNNSERLDDGKQCDLDSGLFSMYIADSLPGTSCICPIAGTNNICDGTSPSSWTASNMAVHRIASSSRMYLYACNGLGCSAPAMVQTHVILPPSITVRVIAMVISDITIYGLVEDYLGTDNVRKENVQATHGNIENWDVAQVTEMQNLFRNHISFNSDIR